MSASEELRRQIALVCADTTRTAVFAEWKAMQAVCGALNQFGYNWTPMQDGEEVTIIGAASDFDVLAANMNDLDALREQQKGANHEHA
jgi:hypothetical protein